jgi:hypothetical protein
MPGYYELCQMSIKYNKRPSVHKIYQHLPLQDPPKFTQIWIFWFENRPSGNPAPQPPNSRNMISGH